MGHHRKVRRENEKSFGKLKRRPMPAHTYEEVQTAGESRLPMITMRQGLWVHVENYGVITVYESDCLKLAGDGWGLVIEGQRLRLIYFTEDDILVAGRIGQMRFL